MTQVLKSSHKSTTINDLIKKFSQNEEENVDYSENHAPQNGKLGRDEIPKIQDRVQCRTCFKYQRPGETLGTCGRMLQGITEEVKK